MEINENLGLQVYETCLKADVQNDHRISNLHLAQLVSYALDAWCARSQPKRWIPFLGLLGTFYSFALL